MPRTATRRRAARAARLRPFPRSVRTRALAPRSADLCSTRCRRSLFCSRAKRECLRRGYAGAEKILLERPQTSMRRRPPQIDFHVTETLSSTPTADGYHMPGEFELHDGCWMLWPERPD